MKTTKNTSSLTKYTLVNDTIQLRLNFNTEIYIKDDEKLRLVKNIIKRMNLSELKKSILIITLSSHKRPPFIILIYFYFFVYIFGICFYDCVH